MVSSRKKATRGLHACQDVDPDLQYRHRSRPDDPDNASIASETFQLPPKPPHGGDRLAN